MPAQTSIPLAFHTDDPDRLKSELERLVSVLATYFAGITGKPHAALVQRRLEKRPLNDATAAFGFITPVSLSKSTDVLRISLPRPDPRNAGLMLAIRRDSTTGTVKLSAPDCLVNGFEIVDLVGDVAMTPIWFDGENYYGPPGALWGT